MPEAAIDTAVVDQVLALDDIGAALADLVGPSDRHEAKGPMRHLGVAATTRCGTAFSRLRVSSEAARTGRLASRPARAAASSGCGSDAMCGGGSPGACNSSLGRRARCKCSIGAQRGEGGQASSS
jgi:hypothetical protein